MTPSELIDHAKSGRNISVAKNASGQRCLVIGSGGRGSSKRIPLTDTTYDQLMTGVATELAGRHGRDVTIDIKIDYYGGQWIEVRSGLLTRRTARIGISPRYISLVQDLLAERAMVAETA